MSNSSFNRAVSFLQNALDTATFSAARESADDAADTPEPRPLREADSLLPGFEPPPSTAPAGLGTAPAEPPETPAVADPFTPPPEASAPPLPGMATTPPEPPPTVVHHQAEKSPLELHPPAQRRAAALAARGAGRTKPATRFSFNATAVLGVLSGVLGIALIAACIGLLDSPETPEKAPSSDIPLALLPETADPELWDTVAAMSGEIDGVPLRFERGLATANGTTYRLQLDFCRSGSDIYAKVAGDKLYVVRLDARGTITKAYPAPKNNRPLRDIFSR